MKLTHPLVVLDLETTGTWIEKDKIIEVAMIKCLPDGKREEYCKRVNPMIPIPKFISELLGIYDKDVEDKPPFSSIAPEITEFIADCDLAGFNVEKFDLPLLEREMYEAGHKFEWRFKKIYDVQKVYHLNERRDLTAAYNFYCQKHLENAHSALFDTKATLDILEKQVEKYGRGKDAIDVLLEFDYIESGDFYDPDRKFRWWNGKLYMMFGKYARRYSLQEVVQKDKGYLEWILSADFSQEVKTLVANALKGRYPTSK
ncbi:MAG: 3'-5' exonuclease [Candidatus Omnitrophica bacterium]|nr:3'-5' exonuclease [Candidatus Omnitrophota bacterium]